MRTSSMPLLAAFILTTGTVMTFAHAAALHAIQAGTYASTGHEITVADTTAPGISLQHIWARPTAGASTTGVTYFTIVSQDQTDKLVGVSTPVAGTAELHETTDDKGVMKMRSVQSVTLAPGKPVTFKPGSYHVMLMGLKAPLKAGDSFPLTLTFEHAQPITVTAKVEATGGGGMAHGGMEGMPGR